MKGLIVTLLVAGVFTPAGAEDATPRNSLAENPRRQLTVRLYNLAGVPSLALNHATAQATGIFADVGLDLVWELGDPDAEEAHTIDQSAVVSRSAEKLRRQRARDHLAIRIGRDMSGYVTDASLGISLPNAQAGVSATIFEDRIESQCKSFGLDLGIILGHVIAHELGHVLGWPEHAPNGIMRAHWRKADFDQAGAGNLKFSALQGAAIRDHAAGQH